MRAWHRAIFVGLLVTCPAVAGEKLVYVRAPVLRAGGSTAEGNILSDVLAAAALLVTSGPAWLQWPATGQPDCVDGCLLVEAQCVGLEKQRCDVRVVEQPSGRQLSGRLSVDAMAPSTDVAQALVLQAAYLLEKFRRQEAARVAPSAGVAAAPPAGESAGEEWAAAIGPSLLVSSGISAWGVEADLLLAVSPHGFLRLGAGYAGRFATAAGTHLDYFHALPVTASFGIRGTWSRVVATAGLGLVVMPVFASSDHVSDSDFAVSGCVELGLRYLISDTIWLSILARPYYGSGDVTLGEAGSEPFVLPNWGVLGSVQIGGRL